MAGSVPEIKAFKDREALEAYLLSRPVIDSQVLAFRCALRVMPLVTLYRVGDVDEALPDILATFRVLFLSYVCLKYPEYEQSFIKSNFVESNFFIFEEYMIGDSSFSALKASSASVAAMFQSFSSPANAVSRSVDAMVSASIAAGFSASVVFAAFAPGSDDYTASFVKAADSAWDQGLKDISFMLINSSYFCLRQEIWWGAKSAKSANQLDFEFRIFLERLDLHWMLIYKFYESLRDGYAPFSNLGNKTEEVLLALAKEGNDFWERHPDVVMHELAMRLAGKAEPSASDDEIDGVQENLIQVAADFRFSENAKGAIDALPFSAQARDPGFAGTTLSEAREKTQELADRLKRANAPGRVMRSVTRLLDALPAQLGDLNPALLRSRSRSLETDAIAYGAAGAEVELFPDAVSELLDVVGTLNDLQGCFPAIAEVERNIAAIDIAGREDKVQPELSVISASARELSAQYPHVMTEAAAEAVAALDADIADAADIEVKRDLLARSLLIKRNFLSAVYRKVLSPAGREALRVGKLHYDGAISGSVDGVKKLASVAFPAAVAFYFTGPVGVLAVLLTGQFKSLKDAKDVVDRLKSGGQRPDNDQD